MKTETGPFTIFLTDQIVSSRDIEVNAPASLLCNMTASVIELTDRHHLKGNPKVLTPDTTF